MAVSASKWKWIGTKEYLTANATRQLETIPPNFHVDLTGCTILITGASGGLGLESARQLYDLKPEKLILAVRDRELGEKAKVELEARTLSGEAEEGSRTIVQIMHLDQVDFSSVKEFSQKLHGEDLDVVMLNAGTVIWDWTLTRDGYEKALQVNYLSTALLALLLLPLLRHDGSATNRGGKLSPARLVFTSSDGHYTAPLSYAKIRGYNADPMEEKVLDPARSQALPILSYLADPKSYDKYTRYLDTKLLLLLFARELASRTPSTSCIVSSVHPGFIATRLFRDASAMNWIMQWWPVKRLFSRTPEQGGRGMVNAAVVKGVESHGKYMSECKIREESAFVRSEDGERMQKQVWTETIDALHDFLDL